MKAIVIICPSHEICIRCWCHLARQENSTSPSHVAKHRELATFSTRSPEGIMLASINKPMAASIEFNHLIPWLNFSFSATNKPDICWMKWVKPAKHAVTYVHCNLQKQKHACLLVGQVCHDYCVQKLWWSPTQARYLSHLSLTWVPYIDCTQSECADCE